MKKKIQIACSFFLILCFLLCGCTSQGYSATNSDSLSASDIETPIPANKNLTLVTSRSGIAYTQYAGTEDGYYEVRANTNGTGNILYTDYESQKTVYLSSQVGSLHNDETDESWLDSVLGGTSIFTDKNKIYIVKRGKPEFFDEFGERGRSYLLQLNKDGSGRKELTLSSNEMFSESSCILSDDASLYLLIERFENYEQNIYKRILVQVDIKTMEKKDVFVFPSDIKGNIIGSCDALIIFKSINIPPEETFSSIDEYFDSMQYALFYLNPYLKNAEIKQFFSYKASEINLTAYNDRIYLYNSKTHELSSLDPKSETTELIEKNIAPKEERFSQIGIVADVYDNHLFFSCADNEIGETKTIAYDLDTGELVELNMFEDGKFVGVYGENSEYFVVMTGEHTVKTPDTAPDGSFMYTDEIVYDFSLIKKGDYWNNISNYLVIDTHSVYTEAH